MEWNPTPWIAFAILAIPCAGQELVGITNDGVYSIDVSTGATSFDVGQYYLSGGADSAEENVLFARTDALNLLSRIDLDAATVTQVGSMSAQVRDFAGDHVRGLLFGTTGDRLEVIDPTNANTATVGTFHVTSGILSPTAIHAIAYDHARDRLLGLDAYCLWEISTQDASCTLVGVHGPGGLTDLHVEGTTGIIYACTAPVSSLVTLDPVTAARTFLMNLTDGPFTGLGSRGPRTSGTAYCSAEPNSTGHAAITASYSPGIAASGSLALVTTNLPPGQPVLLLASQAPGWVPTPAGSAGTLCLIGNIAPFRSTLSWADGSGRTVQFLPTGQVPTRPLPTAIQPGEFWHFQAWYRDGSPAGPTTNFSLPIQLLFQ